MSASGPEALRKRLSGHSVALRATMAPMEDQASHLQKVIRTFAESDESGRQAIVVAC